jgi:hypothetical protein
VTNGSALVVVVVRGGGCDRRAVIGGGCDRRAVIGGGCDRRATVSAASTRKDIISMTRDVFDAVATATAAVWRASG